MLLPAAPSPTSLAQEAYAPSQPSVIGVNYDGFVALINNLKDVQVCFLFPMRIAEQEPVKVHKPLSLVRGGPA